MLTFALSGDTSVYNYDRLLTAVLDALRNPLIILRHTFPITYNMQPTGEGSLILPPSQNKPRKSETTTNPSVSGRKGPHHSTVSSAVLSPTSDPAASITASVTSMTCSGNRFPILTELMSYRVGGSSALNSTSATNVESLTAHPSSGVEGFNSHHLPSPSGPLGSKTGMATNTIFFFLPFCIGLSPLT